MTDKKIQVKWHSHEYEYNDIQDMAVSRLNGQDLDRGELEALSATVENNSEAIGRLLQYLFDERSMDLLQALKIIDGYVGDDTTVDYVRK